MPRIQVQFRNSRDVIHACCQKYRHAIAPLRSLPVARKSERKNRESCHQQEIDD